MNTKNLKFIPLRSDLQVNASRPRFSQSWIYSNHPPLLPRHHLPLMRHQRWLIRPYLQDLVNGKNRTTMKLWKGRLKFIEPRLHFFTSAKLSSQMSVLIPHPLFKSNKYGKSCKNCHEIGSDLPSFIFTQGISRKLFQDFHWFSTFNSDIFNICKESLPWYPVKVHQFATYCSHLPLSIIAWIMPENSSIWVKLLNSNTLKCFQSVFYL